MISTEPLALILILLAAFMHHGQICFSTERVIVLESIAETFTEMLQQKAQKFAPGSGVSKEIVSRAQDRLSEAQKKGANFILGDPSYKSPVELCPTIVTGVTRDMSLFDTESFGPTVSVYVVKDDEEAITVANDSLYGLNASIHTTNMSRAITIARRLEFGQVHINSMTTHNERKSVPLPQPEHKLIGTSSVSYRWNKGEWMGAKQFSIRDRRVYPAENGITQYGKRFRKFWNWLEPTDTIQRFGQVIQSVSITQVFSKLSPGWAD